jgi:hypothetical protein
MSVLRRVVLGAAIVTALLAWGSFASADTVSKCAAAKVNCALGLTKCKLGCFKKAAGTNLVDPACLTKCDGKFDGGAKPLKGCFEKLENKVPNDCQSFDDTGTIAAAIEAFALDIVTDLNATPPTGPVSKCLAGKESCVIKRTACRLGCYKKGNTAGITESACLSKCETGFDGGAEPAKGCFEKLENKSPNDCLTGDDTAAAETKIDTFTLAIACKLDSTRPGCCAFQPAVCGDGCVQAGEACDSPGSQCPNAAPGILCSASCQCACPSKVEITSSGGLKAFDNGWTGIAHDAGAVDAGTFTMNITSCANPARPCGICNMAGPIENVGAANYTLGTGTRFNNHRCSGNTRMTCHTTADCPGAGTCEFYFGSYQPLSAGGTSTCVENRFNGAFTGTLNVETGESASVPHLIARVFLGSSTEHPCARCLGDVTPNDGIRNGTCDAGLDMSAGCDVNGTSPDEIFGSTSLDCRPDSSPNGTLPINATSTTGTATMTLSAASPNCRGAGSSGAKCMCDTCATLAAEPCGSSADCPAGRICGGKRCVSGPSAGSPCTVNSQCPSGFCSIPGELTMPNACFSMTGFDGCQAIGGNKGICAEGPFDQFCVPTATMIGCTGDDDCLTYRSCVGGSRAGHVCKVASDCPNGSCDAEHCSSKARSCFLDGGVIGGSISAEGQVATPVNDAADPKVGAVFCLNPVGASSVNLTAGLPGPFRAQLPLHVQGLP